jgi:transposase
MADPHPKPVFGNPAPAACPQPRLRPLNRSQWRMLNIDVERLIADDHAARAIWDLVGRLDLRAFYEAVKAVVGHPGQPPFDPRLMISIWVYGLSRGISSARELSEWCEWEPGLQWLCAMETVNYHSLSTFRVAHGEALKKLFVNLLAVLSAQGLVGMERVTVDGTRIRSSCSEDSTRKGKGLQEYLEKAAAQVEAVEQEPEGEISRRQQAARERSQRERQERVIAAQQQLRKLEQERGASEAEKVQVSVTEPEARVMKQPGGGGFALSYNLQLATDAKKKVIVGAALSDCGADTRLLETVIEEVQSMCGETPAQVLVDGGYVSADNIGKMQERGIELVGPLPDVASMVNKQAQQRGVSEAYRKDAFSYDAHHDTYRCPQGQLLVHIKQREREGRIEHEYRAKRSDCAKCAHQMECCPTAKTCGRTLVRSESSPLVQTFRDKMQTEAYRQLYRKRSEVAEFPNAWLKEKLGLRRFRLKGMAKVAIESLWAVITYNLQQGIRLGLQQQVAGAEA